jgi:hypothetical protein
MVQVSLKPGAFLVADFTVRKEFISALGCAQIRTFSVRVGFFYWQC